MKNSKGITLVSLIITVVIMLILAGVGISAVIDTDGLFSKTRDAAEVYQNVSRNESDQMQALINEIDEYLIGGNGGEGTDTIPPTTATITSSNVEAETFTLIATGADGESGIAKYEFYLNGTLEKTIETTEETATYKVAGKTGKTNYTCKVRVYDNAGNYKDSSEIIVTTVTPEPKIGDFVNYSVDVDGVTYDKWRILDFDNNGHMEIVCYNGPYLQLGEADNLTKTLSDYANVIKILNDASVPYGEGTYGYSTRHLGSDSSNPSSYATISTSYVKYYGDESNISASTYKNIEQTHHESDVAAIQLFSDTSQGLKFENHCWLASRFVKVEGWRTKYDLHYVSRYRGM